MTQQITKSISDTSDRNVVEQLQARIQQKDSELLFANECLARFTYGISHEMISPTRTLNNLLLMLHEEHASQMDDDGIELVKMITSSAKRLQEVVDGLQEYARYSRISSNDELVDTRKIITKLLEQPGLVTDNAEIQLGQLPTLNASTNAIRALFFHLIKNALTFRADTDVPAHVTVDSISTSNAVEFIISDQGAGIDPDQREAIFEVYKRLHARSAFDGAGLGLSICKQIVIALGGRIWVTAAGPAGAAFHVWIPQ